MLVITLIIVWGIPEMILVQVGTQASGFQVFLNDVIGVPVVFVSVVRNTLDE